MSRSDCAWGRRGAPWLNPIILFPPLRHAWSRCCALPSRRTHMCGFSGVVDLTSAGKEEIQQVIARMTAPLQHRGPDADGAWVDADVGVAFGHRRLAIV